MGPLELTFSEASTEYAESVSAWGPLLIEIAARLDAAR
jgi:hypothetical protein